MADPLEVVEWALSRSIPSSKHVGSDRSRCVLVALATHVSGDGLSWPSAQTLANEIDGLSRRDVRNAEDVLVAAGLISAIDRRRGRSIRWRLNIAGLPASPHAGEPGGTPGGKPGGSARHEAKRSKNHPASAVHRKLLDLLEGINLAEEDLPRLLEISAETRTGDQPTGSPESRLLKVPHHREQVLSIYRQERAAALTASLESEPHCSECGRRLSVCRRANARLDPHDRCTQASLNENDR